MATMGRLAKISHAKESAWGTAVTTDKPLSFTGESLANKIETKEDGRLIGKVFTSDMIKVGEMVSGGIDVTLHPQEAGWLCDYALMKESATATSAQAFFVFYYIGSDAYASVELSTNNLIGKSGADVGSASADWTLDKTSASYDTASEMAAAVIAASADWKCYAFGRQDAPLTLLTSLSQTQVYSRNGLIVPLNSASSSTKIHKLIPAGASDSEVSFTAVVDRTIGTNEAIRMAGCKANSLSIKIPAKDLVTASLDIVGKIEATGITYPSITIPTDDPYVSINARVISNGIESTVTKDLTLTINNALSQDGVVGSAYISEPIRGAAKVNISGAINLDSTAWQRDYDYYTANTSVEFMVFLNYTKAYADSTNYVSYNMLIRVPYVKYTQYDTFAAGPDKMTSSIAGEGVSGSNYENVEIWVTDTRTTAY